MKNPYCIPRSKLRLLYHRANIYVSNPINKTRNKRTWSLQEYMNSVKIVITKSGERYYRQNKKGKYVKDIYRCVGSHFLPVWNYDINAELPF